jgi:hypothetical protein
VLARQFTAINDETVAAVQGFSGAQWDAVSGGEVEIQWRGQTVIQRGEFGGDIVLKLDAPQCQPKLRRSLPALVYFQ